MALIVPSWSWLSISFLSELTFYWVYMDWVSGSVPVISIVVLLDSLWCRELLLSLIDTWASFLLPVCLEQSIISVIISWWFWVFPYTPRRSLFGKSFLICHGHPFVVSSTLVDPHTDPVDLVPAVLISAFWWSWEPLSLLTTLCATWYTLHLWSSLFLWSWVHHRGTNIRLVDISACCQSVRTPDGF